MEQEEWYNIDSMANDFFERLDTQLLEKFPVIVMDDITGTAMYREVRHHPNTPQNYFYKRMLPKKGYQAISC